MKNGRVTILWAAALPVLERFAALKEYRCHDDFASAPQLEEIKRTAKETSAVLAQVNENATATQKPSQKRRWKNDRTTTALPLVPSARRR